MTTGKPYVPSERREEWDTWRESASDAVLTHIQPLAQARVDMEDRFGSQVEYIIWVAGKVIYRQWVEDGDIKNQWFPSQDDKVKIRGAKFVGNLVVREPFSEEDAWHMARKELYDSSAKELLLELVRWDADEAVFKVYEPTAL